MLCLDQRLHYVEQVVTQLRVGASVETLDKALKISSSLPPLSGCTDRPELVPRVPLPKNKAQREKVLEATRLVNEAQAHLDLGSQARAINILEALLKEAPSYAPILAKATSVLGKSKMDLGDLGGAETSLRASIEHGTRAGDDRLVAGSWLALMHLDGIEREDYARGYEHGKMAGLAMVRGEAGALAQALLQRSRAALLIFEGKSKAALTILESITALVEAEGSQTEISVLRTSLGDAEGAEGNYEAALSHYRLALAHIESVLGPDHPENIYILNNMAVALKGTRDIKGARTALERSLAITERSYGDSVRAVVPILNNLGNINRRDGDLNAAREVLRRAIYVGEATMEAGHPLVTKAMLNLGIVLATDKDYPGATQAFRGVLTRSEAHFKDDHPDKAMALNNLGEALFLEKKYEESLKYSLLAKEMKLRIYGTGHPKTASTLASLGTIYRAMGKNDEAQTYYESALAIFHGAAGETHPKTIFALSELGRLHESTGAAKKATGYLRRAIAARGVDKVGLEQATDRFALVRILVRTKGKKAALEAALSLQLDLDESEETAPLEAELAGWIDGQ
jgi:tetratricopeptide (TPR) repeat protein